MTAELIYEGDLRCKLIHVFSGYEITTDAPLDNEGKAQAFSPTDLMATSAGACALTIMGIACRKQGFNIDGATVSVNKVMADNPRRIAEIHLNFNFPNKNYSENEKKIIRNIAYNCPVILSLNTEIKKEITLNY